MIHLGRKTGGSHDFVLVAVFLLGWWNAFSFSNNKKKEVKEELR